MRPVGFPIDLIMSYSISYDTSYIEKNYLAAEEVWRSALVLNQVDEFSFETKKSWPAEFLVSNWDRSVRRSNTAASREADTGRA